MNNKYPQPRTYRGYPGALFFAPHVSELTDPDAIARWEDVYNYGVVSGIDVGIVEERVRASKSLEDITKAEDRQDAEYLKLVVDSMRNGISYPELCRRRGEHERAAEADRLHASRGLVGSESPYWRLRNAGVPLP